VRKADSLGKLCKADFPLLCHVDDIITKGAAVNIPWEAFTFEYNK
jgi:glycerol-3-phosphate dehydrogenase (NAD(P)+)